MGATLVQLGHVAAATPTTAAAYLVAAWLLYQMLRGLYHISPLHPLAHIPGPKVACVGKMYEAYWDWLRDGQYQKRVAEMHEKYGPVVRISHDEVHCSDPYFAPSVFGTAQQTRHKPPHLLSIARAGPLPRSAMLTGPSALHRARRAPMSRFFSRAQILRFEDDVRRLAALVVHKMLAPPRRGVAFDVRQAFNCFTADVVFLHALGRPLGFVERQDHWTPNLATWTKLMVDSTWLLRHNPVANWLSTAVPGLAGRFSANLGALSELVGVTIPALLRSAAADRENDRLFPVLLRAGMDPKAEAVPGVEMDLERLTGEATILLTAGTETTSAALAIITYHILSRPDISAALAADLVGLDPSTLRWTELEQRPYLWAVIHEALRHSPPIVTRSSRVAPDEDLVYHPRCPHTPATAAITIPRGFSVSMSPIMSNHDPGLFPDPTAFRPERWLVPSDDGGLRTKEELRKLLTSFGKGSRACIGEQLAMCEMFIMTAMMVLCIVPRARLDSKMTVDDVTYDHDKVALQTKNGAVAVHMVVS